jgi:hypothetical protein
MSASSAHLANVGQRSFFAYNGSKRMAGVDPALVVEYFDFSHQRRTSSLTLESLYLPPLVPTSKQFTCLNDLLIGPCSSLILLVFQF